MSPGSADRVAFLRSLRAVRSFRDAPVPPDLVEDLKGVIRWSGSAANRQEFMVWLIRDRERLRELASFEGATNQHLAGAALGAAIATIEARGERAAFDEGRVSERIMLTALAHGVGSSIGWISGEGRKGAARSLGLGDEWQVRTTISIGYPAQGAEGGGKRKPSDALVHVI